MNICLLSRSWIGVLVAAVVVLAAGRAGAQTITTPTPAATPALSYGVNDVVQLSKANVGDTTIINYIQNSGSGYGLDASQIIYLKQQGVSDAVLTAMLNQPSRAVSGAPAEAAPTAAPVQTTTTSATYVTPAPVSAPASSVSVYVIPAPPVYSYYTYPRHYLGFNSCWPSSVVYIGGGYRGPGCGGWVGVRGGWHR